MAEEPNSKIKIEEFFSGTPEDNSSCKICGRVLKGRIKWNQERHIFTMHADLAVNYDIPKSHRPNQSAKHEPNLEAHGKRKREETEVKNLKRACVEMMAFNGASFRSFEGLGFRRLTKSMQERCKLHVNRSNAVEFLTEASSMVRKMISQELKLKMFNISVDAATRFGHSILGVTAQFIDAGIVQHRGLAMLPMANRHTAFNISKEIETVLQVYDLSITQVYSISMDNAINMTNAGEFLSEDQQEELVQLSREATDDRYTYKSDETDLNAVGYAEDDAVKENDFIERTIPYSCMEIMRCTAHTVNLAIKDVVKLLNCQTQLKDIRGVVRKCKAVIFRAVFKLRGTPLPVLDCETRWGTTATMVESFISLKSLETDLQEVDKKFEIDEKLLSFALLFTTAFKPIVKLLKNLQKAQLIIGDMYMHYWIETRSALKQSEKENPYSAALLKALDERKKKLFENKAFLAGIFMDPRFNFEKTPYLNTKQKRIALDHLLNTWNIMKMQQKVLRPCTKLSSSMLSDLDRLIEEDCSECLSNVPSVESQLELKLNRISTNPRMLIGTNVVEYWAQQQFKEPELYELSKVALCASPTSVPVERAFSGLVHELTAHRTNISGENLNDLMIIRMNPNLLDEAYKFL